MNDFGKLKTKILQKFTNAYASGNKNEVKKILKMITENKDFRTLYLFYEDFEDKYIEDKKDAELFLNKIIPILKEHKSKIKKISKKLDEEIGDILITENEVYTHLDKITEEDNVLNSYEKIKSNNELINHLMSKKEQKTNDLIQIVENEKLLNSILVNNFNVLYGSTLSEDEQTQLKQIIDITPKELEENFKTLQEDVVSKMTDMIVNEKNENLKTKLIEANAEAKQMKPTKYNYYKLQQLKNGL